MFSPRPRLSGGQPATPRATFPFHHAIWRDRMPMWLPLRHRVHRPISSGLPCRSAARLAADGLTNLSRSATWAQVRPSAFKRAASTPRAACSCRLFGCLKLLRRSAASRSVSIRAAAGERSRPQCRHLRPLSLSIPPSDHAIQWRHQTDISLPPIPPIGEEGEKSGRMAGSSFTCGPKKRSQLGALARWPRPHASRARRGPRVGSRAPTHPGPRRGRRKPPEDHRAANQAPTPMGSHDQQKVSVRRHI